MLVPHSAEKIGLPRLFWSHIRRLGGGGGGAGVQLPWFMGLLWPFHSGSREGHKNLSTRLQLG